MNSIVDRFVEKITEVKVVDDIDILKIRYAISALVNEVAKFIVIIILFYMLDMLTPFLFTLLIIVPIRITTGGLHFNSNTHCLLASLTFFLLTVVLLPKIILARAIYSVILLISAGLILVLPLAPSEKRPIISKNKYLWNKYLSMLFTTLSVLVILFVLDDQYLVRCGVWAFALQAIQLVLLFLKRRYHDVKEND